MTVRIAALAAIVCVLASTAAQADDCAVAMAAIRAGALKPYSATVSMTMSGKPIFSHIVMTGSKMYIQMQGTWHTMPMTAKEVLDQMDTVAKTAKTTCHRGGAEAVNGQAATIYDVHVENQGNASDNRVWISAAGLPLKTVDRMAGGNVATSVYDYAHVQPPAGVK
jgi:hypothetical protein